MFTLGLLAYKILLGPHLPPDMDWDSSLYDPWGTAQEQSYVAAQQRLARDLARGSSSHPRTHALLQQLPQDCRQALARMCDPEPTSRASLEEVPGLAFIRQQMVQLAAYSGARDAAYAAARQQLINLLQAVPGIELAARPGRLSRHSISGSMPNLGDTLSTSRGITSSHSSSCLQWLDAGEGPAPPGAFRRLPRGTNAAREAAVAAAAAAAAAVETSQQRERRQHQSRQQDSNEQQPQQQQESLHPAGVPGWGGDWASNRNCAPQGSSQHASVEDTW